MFSVDFMVVIFYNVPREGFDATLRLYGFSSIVNLSSLRGCDHKQHKSKDSQTTELKGKNKIFTRTDDLNRKRKELDKNMIETFARFPSISDRFCAASGQFRLRKGGEGLTSL